MSAVARSVLQQCISARLMVQPATGSEPAQYVEVSGNTVNRYWKNEEKKWKLKIFIKIKFLKHSSTII